ncbi:MAG: orotidine-5'-phosphate decarboxylase [Hyphomonadaceae bacterium]|nr:orotidine-5'-phosphate decarboxylase [Hyphomonadaceae bacterium]
MSAFADRLIEAVRLRDTPLCVGMDPFPDRIPALFGGGLRAIEAFFAEILEIARTRAAVVKPQIAFFEALGPEGYALTKKLTAEAQAKGLLVILDAKRGDIGSTAAGYAEATIGAGGFDADAVTVNAYLGRDSLEPFLALARERNKGVIVLVRTSNPGARDLQDLTLEGGAPLWTRVAEMLAPEAKRLEGESGWSGLMAVAGATWPEEAAKLRAILPTSLFLVPGYGAQGASARDAVAGFVNGEGGVVSSSRAVLYPPAASEARTLDVWRAAIADAMDAANAELRAALRP